MGKLPTAILGAKGWVGQHCARLLADHPYFEQPILVDIIDSGRKLKEVWQIADQALPGALEDSVIENLSVPEILKRGVKVVFSALPTSAALSLEDELAKGGAAVFTTSPAHRDDRAVPLLVPEINPDHLKLLDARRERGFIVGKSNCTASLLAMALAPIMDMVEPKEIFMSSYQALSGAGYDGISSLAITDNVIPFIANEEERVQAEIRKILGTYSGEGIVPRELSVFPNCVRVGTRDGHLEAITVRTRRKVNKEEMIRAWRDFRPMGDRGLPTAPTDPIIYRMEADRPQPLRDRWAGTPERAKGMALSIGRLRVDDGVIRFFAMDNNSVRGAAGGSLLNAELAYNEGYLDSRR
jgi:aspartate-semialdehyde dehydrogenase